MMSFKKYLHFRQAESQINVIARRLVENQQGNPATAQALDQAKQQLMTAFEKQFQSDANGALTWLNNLYTKVLPQDYKTWFSKNQGQQQQQPAQGQQQAQPAQGQQQAQPAQQGK